MDNVRAGYGFPVFNARGVNDRFRLRALILCFSVIEGREEGSTVEERNSFYGFVLYVSVVVNRIRSVFIVRGAGVRAYLRYMQFFPSRNKVERVICRREGFTVVIKCCFAVFVFRGAVEALGHVVVGSYRCVAVDVRCAERVSVNSMADAGFDVEGCVTAELRGVLSARCPAN